MSADNTPLRGFKQMLDEGGIRTPFIVSWPARFRGGRTVDTPVISFDILPTALDAVGAMPAEHDFDGKSLLLLLEEQTRKHHDTLFWSKGPGDEWAVRRGDWKLHWTKGRMELVDLAKDPSETMNLAADHPDKVRELSAAFDEWIAPMPEPIAGGKKRLDDQSRGDAATSAREEPSGAKPNSQTMTARELERARIREERRAAKKAMKRKERAAKNPSASDKSPAPKEAETSKGVKAPTTPVSGLAPESKFDLSHWKLTLPTDAAGRYGGHPREIAAEQLSRGFKDPPHFVSDPEGDMVFWCPVIGSTTEGTSYPRCELREMLEPGNVRRNWSMAGNHVLEGSCRILQVPSNPKVVVAQIHSSTGESRPLVKLQYFKGRVEALVKVSPVQGQDRKLRFADLGSDRAISWRIALDDGVLNVTVNGMSQSENVIANDPRWADQEFYFKAGVYPQDNDGDVSEGARVSFSKLAATHGR